MPERRIRVIESADGEPFQMVPAGLPDLVPVGSFRLAYYVPEDGLRERVKGLTEHARNTAAELDATATATANALLSGSASAWRLAADELDAVLAAASDAGPPLWWIRRLSDLAGHMSDAAAALPDVGQFATELNTLLGELYGDPPRPAWFPADAWSKVPYRCRRAAVEIRRALEGLSEQDRLAVLSIVGDGR